MRKEIVKVKMNNVARVSKWNEQSIMIELGSFFVPKRFRDERRESTDPFASLQGREGSKF